MTNRIGDEVLIKALREFAEKVDGSPTSNEMRTAGPYSARVYQNLFGSWNKALKAAGLQVNQQKRQDVDRNELLAELTRINEELDHPPRQMEVREMSGYSYDLFEAEFESFVLALEEANIEPTELQYRFSDVETPGDKLGSENLKILQEKGPVPALELPHGVSVSDRRNGVWKFDITTGSGSGSIEGPGGIISPVYYLKRKHAPELVMRRFFGANPHVLENKSLHGLKQHIRGHGKMWGEIAKELLPKLRAKHTTDEDTLENLITVSCTPDSDPTLHHCFEQTVADPIDPPRFEGKLDHFDDKCTIWGFPDDYKAAWQSCSAGDIILFASEDETFTHLMEVKDFQTDWSLSKDLWVEYDDGTRVSGPDVPWPYLVVGGPTEQISVSITELATLIGSLEGNGIEYFDEGELDPLRSKYGSFAAYLRDFEYSDQETPVGADRQTKTIERQLDELMSVFDGEPPLTVEIEFDEHRQLVRENAFREGVTAIYPGCAICGKRREAPDGSEDLEAAHIYPKSEGGPDVPQNGLALCRLHHWAFDSGWFTIDANYQIHIRDLPDLISYDEVSIFDTEQLVLPSYEVYYPHEKYLRAHREYHGFNI